MIEWEHGEITAEPRGTIAADDPVTCAINEKENNLLEFDGWKRLKSITKREKMLKQLIHQVKLRLYRTTQKFKYGFEFPREYNHAMELDKRNGKPKWTNATKLEMDQ
jgi:hypothetical protein